MARYAGPLNYAGMAMPLSDDPAAWMNTNGTDQTLQAGAVPTQIVDGYGGGTLIGGAADMTFMAVPTTTVVAQAGHINTLYLWAWNADYTIPANVQVLIAAGNNLVIHTNGLNDYITGDSNGQTFTLGSGNDVITGGGGNDVYVLTSTMGHDVVTDFNTGSDIVSLSGFSQYTNFAEVKSLLSQQGSDVVLTLDNSQSVIFRDHQVSDFSASNFHLNISTDGMTLTFGDDFNTFSGSADGVGTTWKTAFGTDEWTLRTLSNMGEQEYYSDSSVGVNPFSIVNGALDIHVAPSTGNELNLPYTSGIISAGVSHSQTYGYFEMRAELPTGNGMWPTFWLVPTAGGWPPELDILEARGGDPFDIAQTLHSGATGTPVSTSFGTQVPNTQDSFHTYGVLWGPDTITWYFDGTATASIATPADMHQPMYLQANVAVGPFAGTPDADFTGADMLIDYIHAYSYDSAAAVLGDTTVGTSPGTTTSTDTTTPAFTPAVATPAVTNTPPTLTAPDTASATDGQTLALSHISIADTQTSGDLTVTLHSDHGLFSTTATSGVSESGENSGTLTLTGSVSAINAELATLGYSYHDTAPASGSTVTDNIGITVDDGHGGTDNHSIAVTVAAPASTGGITLSVAEDAYHGDAQFIVVVDGQQVGGTFTATASHANGQYQTVNIAGDFSGAQNISVQFVNDASGNDGDRNLYVASLAVNGQSHDGSGAAISSGSGMPLNSEAFLYANGTASFNVAASSAGHDTLTFHVSEDAYNGDAQFAVVVDGQQVGNAHTVTASHADGQWQDITVTGNFAGASSIGLQFLNDASGNDGDRNMYVQTMTLDGTTYQATSAANDAGVMHSDEAALYWNGAVHFDHLLA